MFWNKMLKEIFKSFTFSWAFFWTWTSCRSCASFSARIENCWTKTVKWVLDGTVMVHLKEQKESRILLGLCSSSPMIQRDLGIAVAPPDAAPWHTLSALLAGLSVAPDPPQIAAETSEHTWVKFTITDCVNLSKLSTPFLAWTNWQQFRNKATV